MPSAYITLEFVYCLHFFVRGSGNITSLMWNWEPVGEGFRCVANPAYVIIEKLCES